MKKIRVLIIEDSQVIREFLEHIIASDPRLEVVGSAGSAEEGIELIDRVAPDVISLDIRLPRMNGFEATRKIMSERPTPIVVCSASVESEELNITMNALRAGALSVVEKPVGVSHADYQRLAQTLCSQLAIMSEVKVVRQRSFGAERRPLATTAAGPRISNSGMMPGPEIRIVGIGASTGGPNAIVRVLTDLGPRFPLPVLAVQHIMSGFLEGFVRWLDGMTPFAASIAKPGELLAAGCVYLAPADRHIELNGDRIAIPDTPPVSSQRPSATRLFASMAASAGPAGLGVLLTGMGDDGADGLLELRRAGGMTIAEHGSTTVVNGMPKAAVDRGAARECLPLGEIGPRILQFAQARKEVSDGRFTPSSHR